MNAKHTPGPWKVAPNGIDVIRNTCHIAESKFVIGGDRYFPTKDEARNNALLIAAAPDLLAALESLLHVFGDLPAARNYPTIVQCARAALAKAKP